MPVPAAASAARPSAVGAGAVSSGDGAKREFRFEVVTREDGSAAGTLTLTDAAGVPEQDLDGTNEPEEEDAAAGIEMTVEVDSLNVAGNRAALSGIVTSTNRPRYAGLRVIVAVEDNGDGGKAAEPDKITWGVYPKAVERAATDAENPDAGVRLIHEGEFDSRRFPLSSYTLSAIEEGDIQVRH